MKKYLTTFVLCLVTLVSATSQAITSDRPFFAAVHQYVTDYSGNLESADVSVTGTSAETYIIRGACFQWSKYEGGLIFGDWAYYVNMYTMIIQKSEDGVINVSLNENFKSAKFSQDMSRQITDWKDETGLDSNATSFKKDVVRILNGYISGPDSQYEEYVNSAVTDLQFLSSLSRKKSSLWMKTFMKRNNIVGRTANVTLKVESVEESDDYNYLYKLLGTVGTANKATGEVAVPVVYYSNDDAVIDASKGRTLSIVAKVVEIEMSSEDGSIIAFKLAD